MVLIQLEYEGEKLRLDLGVEHLHVKRYLWRWGIWEQKQARVEVEWEIKSSFIRFNNVCQILKQQYSIYIYISECRNRGKRQYWNYWLFATSIKHWNRSTPHTYILLNVEIEEKVNTEAIDYLQLSPMRYFQKTDQKLSTSLQYIIWHGSLDLSGRQ